ncbi:MAG: hypothetical protein ABSF70_14870 [Terracidiphilus sp.]|jgi:hypothetical protein
MGAERKNIYDDLKRDLRGFPVDDYVRAYAKAYLEADLETIRKLEELLTGDATKRSEPGDLSGPDAPIGAPIRPRPNLNSGAIALPVPDDPGSDQQFIS